MKTVKNLLFNGIHSQISFDLLSELSARLEIESVVAITSKPELTRPVSLPSTKLSLLSYQDLVHGRYPIEVTGEIDQELFDRLGSYLFNLLKMMDRNSPETVYSFESRVQMLWSHLNYWNSILREGKVDCFISINYPHEIYDYAIYALCKIRGIRTLFFTQTQINGFVQLLESIEGNDPAFKDFDKLDGNDIALSPMMEKHWRSQTKQVATPFYMTGNLENFNKQQNVVNQLLRQVSLLFGMALRTFRRRDIKFNHLIRAFFYRSLFGTRAEKNLFSEEKNRITEVRAGEKYIFVPLHFQPECTTCPQGGVFVYQELMLQLLDRHLPDGVFIYVKEHPVQRIHGRSPDFYRRLTRLSRVRLIDRSLPSKNLIQNSLAVATVTGTAGWEALFLNKPVLLFGDIFFEFAPGVFRIKNAQDLAYAMEQIFGLKIDRDFSQKLRSYLKLLDQALIRAWIDPLYEKTSEIDSDLSLQNLVLALEKKLKSAPSNRS